MRRKRRELFGSSYWWAWSGREKFPFGKHFHFVGKSERIMAKCVGSITLKIQTKNEKKSGIFPKFPFGATIFFTPSTPVCIWLSHDSPATICNKTPCFRNSLVVELSNKKKIYFFGCWMCFRLIRKLQLYQYTSFSTFNLSGTIKIDVQKRH